MVVNACGTSNDYKRQCPLYEALSDTLKFTRAGSLDIDPKTFRVRSDVAKGIYACGPPIYGNLIVVNFIKVIAEQANVLIDDIFS